MTIFVTDQVFTPPPARPRRGAVGKAPSLRASHVRLSFGTRTPHAFESLSGLPPEAAARLAGQLAGILRKGGGLGVPFPLSTFRVTLDRPFARWSNSRYFIEVEALS